MLFSSLTFLFCFLPFVILVYYLLPKRLRNMFLLLASIIFYAWGEPKFLFVMFITILTNYYGTRLLFRFQKYKKYILAGTIVVDLAFLCYFKYVDFLIESFNAIFKTQVDILHIALPLGISFYTFQAISYTVDVYRGNIKPQKSLYKLALYISLFPQLIAGPIVKYYDIADQIDNRQETVDKFYYGFRRFIVGLARKVLIANTLGVVVDKIVFVPLEELTILECWVAVVCYAFQIYNDFGGYADMAIGLCAMFGFKIKENFNFPLLSKSYTEFWRRWHISLGTWVKEYIYIPLGGNKCSALRHYMNLFIAFFTIGIWHGADANMVVLGIYNAIIVVFEKLTGWSKEVSGIFLKIIHHIYMIPVLGVSYFFLKSPDFVYTIAFLKRMFGISQSPEGFYTIRHYLNNVELIVLIVAFLGATSVLKKIITLFSRIFIFKFLTDFALLVMLFLSVSFIAASTYNPFIYFRF